MLCKNPLSNLTSEQKKNKYWLDVNNPEVRAYSSSGDSNRLGKISFNDVEFIGGLWRVQNKFDKEIVTVHRYAGQKAPKDFVILEKLNVSEPFPFNYYKVAGVTWNCYGVIGNTANYILGECYGHLSYGNSVPEARAFLSQKLISVHKEEFFKIVSERQKR